MAGKQGNMLCTLRTGKYIYEFPLNCDLPNSIHGHIGSNQMNQNIEEEKKLFSNPNMKVSLSWRNKRKLGIQEQEFWIFNAITTLCIPGLQKHFP